jgi:endonuclease/exonuclease/phosphatase family metal-dependent hydrolase
MMRPSRKRLLVAAGFVLIGAVLPLAGGETFRVATYNLNNYVEEDSGTRLAKTEASRAKIRQSILALKADVIALQEMGGARPFQELRRSLQAEGVDYPHAHLMFAHDTNIQVAVLSKFPITACRQHTNDSYLLMGRRHFVQRGVLEVQIQVNSNYVFTALVVHLKSRRQATEADETEMRLQEALILREKVDALLKARRQANLVVLGDLNDVKDSRPVRAIIGRYRDALQDTRPAERNGDDQPSLNSRWDPAWITWTHFFAKEDTYSRIDYILLSPGMAREWVQEETRVLALPNWGVASDHRPIVAGFVAEDR